MKHSTERQRGLDLAGDSPFAGLDPVLLRTAHIRHETSLKSVAILLLFWGLGGLLKGGMLLFSSLRAGVSPGGLVAAGMLILVGATQFFLFRSLLRLERGALLYCRVAFFCFLALGIGSAVVTASLNGLLFQGLFYFCPLGIVAFSPKSKVVLNPHYREVIAKAPQIRMPLNKGAFFVLGVLLVLLVFVLATSS